MITKEKIIQLEYELIEAIKSGNIHFLENILHDDLLFLAPNGQIVTKAMDLNSHKSGEMTVEQLLPAFEDLQIIGDTAVSIVVYDTAGTMLGQSIRGHFRYIRTWKVFSNGMKIISGACIQIP